MRFDRRSFLRAIGLTGASWLVGSSPSEARTRAQSTSRNAFHVSGSVRSQGKGIPGVVVSDGVEVTVTNAKGRFSFLASSSSEFVFISTPRGYAFNNEKGITNFFKRIDFSRPGDQIDFDLQKLAVDDTRHNFLVWADPQIQNSDDARLLHMESAPDTKRLVEGYGTGALFHGIGCGDLVWDKFDLFPEYKSALAKTGIPFFQVIGNHDMDLDSRADDHASDTFKKEFGPTYYSFNRGDVHYVVLDDVFFLGTSKKYIGYITEAQFKWLERDLAHVKPGTTVVVSVHIPVNTGVKKRYDLKEEPAGGVVANRKELYRILKPFNAHIMSGHTHFNEKVFEGDNIIEHVHGTVCGAWWTGPICYDGTPNGYGVYEVHGSELTWYYKSVGFDRDYQMRVYPVGACREKSDSISINVWNWDPLWKVEWTEDGVNKGEAERMTGHDPLSIELHEGSEKPLSRGWVEPVLTDHMFFVTPSRAAETIEVIVTDRFGRVYRNRMKRAEFMAGA